MIKLIIILLVITISSYAQIAEHQKQIVYYKERDMPMSSCGNCRLVVTHKYIFITTDATETFIIINRVRIHGKIFYKVKNGWIVLMVDSAILQMGIRETRYIFKPKRRPE